MAKRTRQRQLKRLAERRAMERRRRQRRKAILSGALVLALVGAAGAGAFAILRGGDDGPRAGASSAAVACDGEVPEAASEEKPRFEEPPDMQLDGDLDYRATVVTSCGTFELDLFEDDTPVTVNNFVFLAEQGFYDGLTFHRVVPTFVIQAGDPKGDGTGGPGYTFEDEILPGLRFDEAGLLAMANTGEPDSNGSQWFVTVDPAPDLDPPRARHTIFGRVTRGMDVVRRINVLPVEGPRRDTPTATVYIERVRIRTR